MSFQDEIDMVIKQKRLYFVGDQLPPDWYAGFKQWLTLAEAGDVKAQYNVGRCYQRGDGVEKRLDEAGRWFRKAIEGGESRSLFNLYTLLKDPSYSAYSDAEAAELLQRSVASGDERALQEISSNGASQLTKPEIAQVPNKPEVNIPSKEELIATGTAILAAAKPQLTQARGLIDVIIKVIGKANGVCYLSFFLATIFLSFSKRTSSLSIYQAASRMDISLLLYISYFSFLLPIFWKKPTAWASFGFPFLSMTYIWYIYASTFITLSLSVGFFLAYILSMYLAFMGFKNMIQNKPT